MSEENTEITIGGEKTSLSDLAGFDFSGVDEVRSVDFPSGTFVFEVSGDPAPSLETMEINDKENPNSSGKITVAVAKFALKCVDIVRMPPTQIDGDPSPKVEDVIGKTFYDTHFLSKPEQLGRLKAFLTDAGVAAQSGTVNEVMMAAIGKRFIAPVTKRRNPNDKDVVWTNLDMRKITPSEG